MRYTRFVLLILLVSCGQQRKKGPDSRPRNLLIPGIINKVVAKQHQQLIPGSGDFNSYKEYLANLSDSDAAAIPFALDYIKTCLPANLPQRDSVFYLFNLKFFKVANPISEELYTQYATVLKQIENEPKAPRPKAFIDNLKACGIGVFSTEGNYYLDVSSDYFYKNFKGRVSDGVRTFLYIRKREMAEGFSEDAGLLISFNALYGRVKQWDKFLNDYPNTLYTPSATDYYNSYLRVLMTGMDNSRTFDDIDSTLMPEVKSIYRKAIHEDKNSRTSKIISSYYDFLARHNFKYDDSVDVFLKQHGLSTMIGIQPDTR